MSIRPLSVVAGILVALGCRASVAQEPLCFTSGGCLDANQQRLYAEARAKISSDPKGCASSSACVARVVALDNLISALPLFSDGAREFLRSDLVTAVASQFPADDPRMLALLDSPGIPRATAIWALSSDDKWPKSDRVRARVLALLRSDATPDDVRASVLEMFAASDLFATVAPDALLLASQEAKPDLARDAAQIYVWNLGESDQRVDLVRALVQTAPPAIAESASEYLLSRNLESENSDLFPVLVRSVAALAESHGSPPKARGEAIEALVYHADAPSVVPVILRLLSPPDWFFGASGQHFAVHSLCTMIVPLSHSPNDQIRRALNALPALVHSIPESEGRDYVQWEIQHWIIERD